MEGTARPWSLLIVNSIKFRSEVDLLLIELIDFDMFIVYDFDS